jgi:hypothetical protein
MSPALWVVLVFVSVPYGRLLVVNGASSGSVSRNGQVTYASDFLGKVRVWSKLVIERVVLPRGLYAIWEDILWCIIVCKLVR